MAVKICVDIEKELKAANVYDFYQLSILKKISYNDSLQNV